MSDNKSGSFLSRKSFIKKSALIAASAALPGLFACGRNGTLYSTKTPDFSGFDRLMAGKRERLAVADRGSMLLLKNGIIVDGSGAGAYRGDLLISGNRIEMVTAKDLDFRGQSLDCTGMVIAPGFIDMHAHQDFVFPVKNADRHFIPYIRQGVTTFFCGNCGFSAAGFKKKSPFKSKIEGFTKLFSGSEYTFAWESMDEYQRYLRGKGTLQNMLMLAGDGTTRISLQGYSPRAMTGAMKKEYLYLMEEAMEQGARGASLGLQYEPGIFATDEDLYDLARLVKKHDKMLTVHMKAYSALSPTYPLNPFGESHNLIALKEMLKIAGDTGVRLQASHLIFVGEKSFDTCSRALELIDEARSKGTDVMFDTYAYNCGISKINVFMPKWFLEKTPAAFTDRGDLLRLRAELELITFLLGFGMEDIRITNALVPEYNDCNGMFIHEIAEKKNMSNFEVFVDLARKSGGEAHVLNSRYSSQENVMDMMRHPLSIFMTDATVMGEGVQNPAAFGNFPRFLQLARDYGHVSLEQVVRKMTGASAQQFGLKDRGLLKKGYAADITVFDWKNIADNNVAGKTDQSPRGIGTVIVNGTPVLKNGIPVVNRKPGMVL